MTKEQEEFEKQLAKQIRKKSSARKADDVPRIYNYGTNKTKFYFCEELGKGRAVFNYSFGKVHNMTPDKATVPITNMWCDPTMNAACVIMKPDMNSPDQNRFYKRVKQSSPGYYEGSFAILAKGGVIVWAPLEVNTLSVDTGLSRFRKYEWFVSKHNAIEKVIQEASNFMLIGGLQSVDFNDLSDSAMRVAGFDNIKDEMGSGSDIWWGNARHFLGNGTGREKIENCRNMLKMLDDDLSTSS